MSTTTEGDRIRAAILASPLDDQPRLAYADWLDAHDRGIRGLGLRAALIRWQVRGDGVPHFPGSPPFNISWFIDKRHLWEADKISHAVRAMAGTLKPGDPGFGSCEWDCDKDRTIFTETGETRNRVRLTYRRGFLEEVSGPLLSVWNHILRRPMIAFATLAYAFPLVRVSTPDVRPLDFTHPEREPPHFTWPNEFSFSSIGCGGWFDTAQAARDAASHGLIAAARSLYQEFNQWSESQPIKATSSP